MCGFIAYIGKEEAPPVLLDALSRLGANGHHAAGLAVQNGNGIERRRVAGSVRRLERLVEVRPILGTAGIAHVRWSSEEPATAANANPHVDCHDELAVVLAGVLEGTAALRGELERRGHVFRSLSDAETVAHLVEDMWLPPLHLSLARALERVEGHFAMAAMSVREPGRLVCASRGVPLFVGVGDEVTLVASEEEALRPWATRVVQLEEGEIVVLDASGYDVLRHDGVSRLARPLVEIGGGAGARTDDRAAGRIDRGARETPEVISWTLRERLSKDAWSARLGELTGLAAGFREAGAVRLVPGGSSRPAAALGARMLREIGLVPAHVAAARSVARACTRPTRSVVIGVARAGERTVVGRALRTARLAGVPALCLDGAPPTSEAGEIVPRIGLRTGPGAVTLSARAFAAEATTLALLALWVGRLRGLGEAERRRIVEALEGLPGRAREALAEADAQAARLAAAMAGSERVWVLGTGYGAPAAREAARWLRLAGGLSAIGVSADPSGVPPELPPGATAILLACDEGEARLLRELGGRLRASGHVVLGVGPGGSQDLDADVVATVPLTLPAVQPLLALVPIQRLSCHLGAERQRVADPGRPGTDASPLTREAR